MADQVPSSEMSDITNDDKLWALLGYIFSPIVPVIVLLIADKKSRPFIKYHNVQSLVIGVVILVLSFLLAWTVFLACVPFVIWLVMVYWGIQAYQGKWVEIPLVTNFVKKQGWA